MLTHAREVLLWPEDDRVHMIPPPKKTKTKQNQTSQHIDSCKSLYGVIFLLMYLFLLSDFHHQVRVAAAGDDEAYFAEFSGSAVDIAATINQVCLRWIGVYGGLGAINCGMCVRHVVLAEVADDEGYFSSSGMVLQGTRDTCQADKEERH